VYKAKTKKDLIALDESIDEVISEEEEVQWHQKIEKN
jgi:hypothetical protein